jgi:hypothetical protein
LASAGLKMDGAAGERSDTALQVTFDPRLKLEFHFRYPSRTLETAMERDAGRLHKGEADPV